jgi:hypothetical protein
MEVIHQEILETTVPATEIVELDVSMLAIVAGGSGAPSID